MRHRVVKVSAEAAKSRAVQTEADRWSSFRTEAAFLNQLSVSTKARRQTGRCLTHQCSHGRANNTNVNKSENWLVLLVP